MVELKEIYDKVVQEKHKEDGDWYGHEVSKYTPHINECQLHNAKHETFFIQENDFKSGRENCFATTEPSKPKDQISILEVDPASCHGNSLECSKQFSGKDNCNAPCFAIVTAFEDQVIAKDATPEKKSSASTPGPAVLAMVGTGRNKKGKMKPLHRNQFCMAGSTPDWNSSASTMGKGKGPATSDAVDSRSSSNMRGDGLENIESTSNRRIISAVKRVRIDDSEKLIGGKRLKRLTNGNCSSTLSRQENSFMNWVTAITNGLISPRDAHMESSQHFFLHKKGGLSPLPISEEKREDVGGSHGTGGFRSNFKALYHPGYKVGSVEIKCVDHPKETGALKETDGRKAGNGCAPRERMNLDPHSSLPASSFSFGEGNKEHFSNGLVNFSTAGIASREDWNAAHNKVLASSSRLNQDICQVEKYSSATMGTCAELMTGNIHIFQKSSWITQLSGRVSSPEPRSLHGLNCLYLADHKFLNVSMHNLPCLKSQTNRANEEPQPRSISHTDSHVSERIVTDKLESKVHLAVSSQTCKRSEPMLSTFSRRLNALKQAKPSRFDDKDPGASRICLFCGMCDHIIKECSEVLETKLEDYLKSISVYDSIKKASCFCILCLKLDHWAAECPNVSSKGNQILYNEFGFSDGNIKNAAVKKNGIQPSTNYDGAMIMCSEGRQDQHQFVHGSNASQRVGDLSNVSFHKNDSAGHGLIDLCMDEVDGTTNTCKMKVSAFCSQESELKISEFASFHNPLSTTIMSEPKGIFVAVRKLWLARTDILRWMKLSTPHFNLDGFYLRLRLGIPEKGLGGTGYYVACINGACCKTFISVCVGSSTYSVSSRFISNHYFDEDELNVWWFKKTREGSKMPTREELNEKLELRVKFGF